MIQFSGSESVWIGLDWLIFALPVGEMARMAELADALYSGCSVRTDVQVRFLFRAPRSKIRRRRALFAVVLFFTEYKAQFKVPNQP